MTTGTGIFLSTLIVVLVILYLKRQRDWRFKQIIKWLIAIPLFIALIAGLIYSYHSIPKKVTSFKNIALGETLRDIEFKHGLLLEDEDGYLSVNKDLSVAMHNGRVNTITYTCGDNSFYSSTINGIGCGSSSEEILKKYGRGAKVDCFPETNQVRRIYIQKYSLVYILHYDSVTGFAIHNSKNVAFENGEKCN